jgi:hypothetical protein
VRCRRERVRAGVVPASEAMRSLRRAKGGGSRLEVN